jgi:hypothetical protein
VISWLDFLGLALSRPQVKRCFEALKDEGRFEVSDNILRILKAEMQGGWTTEAECSATIEAVFERTGYLLDPVRAAPPFFSPGDAFGDIGATFRELEWNRPIFSGRLAPRILNASHAHHTPTPAD